MGSSEDELWLGLWPCCGLFIAFVWTIFCADMLDCVLIYVDKCVFKYIDMDGCKSYVFDIIIHDAEYKI